MTAAAPALLPVSRESFLLDDRIRGMPPGTAGMDSGSVGAQGWHPAGGLMSLPVLTLDEAAFARNRDLFLRYVREQGADIAPHAKTPMAPDLARSLLDAGAWGTTVADIRQAAVMLRAGLHRLILANDVGGTGGAARLARLVKAWPQAEIYVFADSVAAVSCPVGCLARRRHTARPACADRTRRRSRRRPHHPRSRGYRRRDTGLQRPPADRRRRDLRRGGGAARPAAHRRSDRRPACSYVGHVPAPACARRRRGAAARHRRRLGVLRQGRRCPDAGRRRRCACAAGAAQRRHLLR